MIMITLHPQNDNCIRTSFAKVETKHPQPLSSCQRHTFRHKSAGRPRLPFWATVPESRMNDNMVWLSSKGHLPSLGYGRLNLLRCPLTKHDRLTCRKASVTSARSETREVRCNLNKVAFPRSEGVMADLVLKTIVRTCYYKNLVKQGHAIE